MSRETIISQIATQIQEERADIDNAKARKIAEAFLEKLTTALVTDDELVPIELKVEMALTRNIAGVNLRGIVDYSPLLQAAISETR